MTGAPPRGCDRQVTGTPRINVWVTAKGAVTVQEAPRIAARAMVPKPRAWFWKVVALGSGVANFFDACADLGYGWASAGGVAVSPFRFSYCATFLIDRADTSGG